MSEFELVTCNSQFAISNESLDSESGDGDFDSDAMPVSTDSDSTLNKLVKTIRNNLLHMVETLEKTARTITQSDYLHD